MALQYMTQEGLDKLKKELAEALAQRPVISAAIAEARDKGDLSENAEYEAAREAQGLLELQIAKLQNLVANARVIDESQIGTDKVQMLNKVKVKNLNTNQVMNFTLVSEQEADFTAGKLAAKTPIGQALMGHAVAYGMKLAKTMGHGSVLINLSGRGDKDMDYVIEHYGIR